MKAIISTAYGPPDVLQLQEIPTPIPKDDEVRIKIHASTVTAGDCEMRRFDFPAWIWLPFRLYMGVRKPRINILGQELAGAIDAVGKNVTSIKKGDRVFAPTDMQLGAHAEYRCISTKNPIAIKPESLSYEAAATLPTGGLNALHFIKTAKVKSGQKVLVNGAGGCIGTYAIQILKSMGAEVTAVDAEQKLEKLLSIGADHVIDYTKEDFGKSGKTYDAIIDIVGKQSFSRCVKALHPGGIYVMGNPTLSGIFRGFWVGITSRKKAIAALASYKQEDLDQLKRMVEAGQIKPVIDRTYPLEHIADAHRYVESGLKAGNVVVSINNE